MCQERLLVRVVLWLDDVKQLADDVEEILAEISKQASRFKPTAQSQTTMGKESSLKSLIPPCFTGSNTRAVASFDDSLISRIIDINSRLEELDARRGYELRVTPFVRRGGGYAPSRPIYGRDEDKEKILEMVLRDEVSDHANFTVIPIIGTAGVGKTTLTRLVYDCKAVEAHFKPRAWVSLYEDSNVFRISKAILESITSKSCNLKDLDEVLVQLKEAIFGRKFLFVFDDVSTLNYGLCETLKSSFMAGAPGSKIIVITRRVDIEFPVNLNILRCPLEVLSDEACLSMIKKQTTNYRLRSVEKSIIDMCKGLPLAVDILCYLTRYQYDEEWEFILNTKIWDLVDDNEILPVLKLSYRYLPLLVQRCLVYCAILPDGYEFEEKDLVFLWIAEGLIGGAQEDEQMEDRGSDVFEHLLKMFLFQPSSSHASKFRMHDLVKSMARWISGETDFRLDDVEHLTTFLPGLIRSDDTRYISDPLLSDLLPKFKRLRALFLEKQNITELPSCVEGLRDLRYVNLSNTLIRRLPDSICSLLILQILLLRDCSHLVELPLNLKNLINLRHLDITGANLIREMPLGMKELECLITLLSFIIGRGVGSDLKDLENIKYLRELYISGLDNVTGSQDTRESVLVDKNDLKVLVLEWGSQLDGTRDELVEENVLDDLQPHRNLRKLTIRGYGGARFSSWVGDPTYFNLVVLTLERCERCIVLPPLGWLGLLKILTVKGMTGIKRIGSEIGPFRSLETLCFEDMKEWGNWDLVEELGYGRTFPCLNELSLVKCPKLRGKLPKIHSLCFKLTIQECERLEVSFPSLPSHCVAEVDGCKLQWGDNFDFVHHFDRIRLKAEVDVWNMFRTLMATPGILTSKSEFLTFSSHNLEVEGWKMVETLRTTPGIRTESAFPTSLSHNPEELVWNMVQTLVMTPGILTGILTNTSEFPTSLSIDKTECWIADDEEKVGELNYEELEQMLYREGSIPASVADHPSFNDSTYVSEDDDDDYDGDDSEEQSDASV